MDPINPNIVILNEDALTDEEHSLALTAVAKLASSAAPAFAGQIKVTTSVNERIDTAEWEDCKLDVVVEDGMKHTIVLYDIEGAPAMVSRG